MPPFILSKNQIDLLSGIHSPFLDPATGAFITFGLPPSCEIADNGKSLKNGFDDWMSAWFFRRANIDPSKVDLHKYAIEFKKRFSQDTDAAPNLGKFRKYGKKLLIIQGKIDTIVPAEYIKDWYKLLCKNTGSTEKTLEYARVFLARKDSSGDLFAVKVISRSKAAQKNTGTISHKTSDIPQRRLPPTVLLKKEYYRSFQIAIPVFHSTALQKNRGFL